MITVEELIVSSLYHRLVLVNVKRTPDPPQAASSTSGGNEGNKEGQGGPIKPLGDHATNQQGLGFLFMGAMSPAVKKAFTGAQAGGQGFAQNPEYTEAIEAGVAGGEGGERCAQDQTHLASADSRALLKALGESGEEVQFSREVQTVLDTGEIQMLTSMMESTETQTDFPPMWCFEPNLNYDLMSPMADLEGDGGGQSHQMALSGATGLAMPPIDLSNCEGFSIVRLEDIRNPGKGSLVMVQTNRIKDSNEKREGSDKPEIEASSDLGSESQRGSCTSDMLQISTGPSAECSPGVSPLPSPTMATSNTAVYVKSETVQSPSMPSGDSSFSAEHGEIDSGIWDMIQGMESKISTRNSTRESTPSVHRGPRVHQVDDHCLTNVEQAKVDGQEGEIRPTQVTGLYRKYNVGPGGDAPSLLPDNGIMATPEDSEGDLEAGDIPSQSANDETCDFENLSDVVQTKSTTSLLDRDDSNETSGETVVDVSPNEESSSVSHIYVTKIPSRSVSPRLEEVEEESSPLNMYEHEKCAIGSQSPKTDGNNATPREVSSTLESSESNASSPASLSGRYRMFSISGENSSLRTRQNDRPSNRLHESLLRQPSGRKNPDAEIKFVIQSSESEFSAETSASSSVTELSPVKSPMNTSEYQRMSQSLTYDHPSADGSMSTNENIFITDCSVEQEFVNEIYAGRIGSTPHRASPNRRPHRSVGLNSINIEQMEAQQSPARRRRSPAGLNVMSNLFGAEEFSENTQPSTVRGVDHTPDSDGDLPPSTNGRSADDMYGSGFDSGHRFHSYDVGSSRENSPPKRTQMAAREAGIMLHADRQGKMAIASRRDRRQSTEPSSLESSHMFDSELALDTFTDDLSVTDFDISAYDAPEFIRHSDWMKKLPADKHSVPLTQLTIPGSHICLAIDKDMRTDMDFSKCNYEMADFLRKLPPLTVFNNFRSLMKKIWKAWMPKQMLSVYHQLEAGSRFLDIRITKFRSAFYGEHGLYTKQFRVYLKEIRQFVNEHPQELVLLHFHSLNQLEKSDKRRLVTQLFQVFGARLARVSKLQDLTLMTLWRQKKQVVVIFPKEDLPELENHIFAGLIWSSDILLSTESKQQTVSDMIEYLELKYVTEKPFLGADQLYNHQAALSPDMTMVFGDFQYKSMRELHMQETSGAISSWVECKPELNIVTLDFIGMGDVTSHIIWLNYPPKQETMV